MVEVRLSGWGLGWDEESWMEVVTLYCGMDGCDGEGSIWEVLY